VNPQFGCRLHRRHARHGHAIHGHGADAAHAAYAAHAADAAHGRLPTAGGWLRGSGPQEVLRMDLKPMINQQFFGHPIVRHTHMELVKYLLFRNFVGHFLKLQVPVWECLGLFA